MSKHPRDTFCSYCGTRFPEPFVYPRKCPCCSTQIWANPIPVVVVLAPIVDGDRTGLLAIRRAIPPGIGKLALVGGFLEEHESWEVGGAREVFEETGIVIDPANLSPFYFVSSSPRPNRVLLFAIAKSLSVESLARFSPDSETSERGIIYGAGGLDEVFAFSLHVEAARRYFATVGVDRSHAFAPR